MRTFVDEFGRYWDVAVSEASYGAQYLLFALREGRELRAYQLACESRFDAEQTLLSMDERELRRVLADASAWHPG